MDNRQRHRARHLDPLPSAHHHHLDAGAIVEHFNPECSTAEHHHFLFGAACLVDHEQLDQRAAHHNHPSAYDKLHLYICAAGHEHDGYPACPLSGSRLSNHHDDSFGNNDVPTGSYDDYIDPATTSA